MNQIFIRVAKVVDVGVIGVEVPKQQQRLKVYRMSLARYFREEKLEILYRKIKSSTGIQLKTGPCQQISESRLKKHLESGTRRRSAIGITVGTSEEVVKLCSKRLRFRGAVKLVKRY